MQCMWWYKPYWQRQQNPSTDNTPDNDLNASNKSQDNPNCLSLPSKADVTTRLYYLTEMLKWTRVENKHSVSFMEDYLSISFSLKISKTELLGCFRSYVYHDCHWFFSSIKTRCLKLKKRKWIENSGRSMNTMLTERMIWPSLATILECIVHYGMQNDIVVKNRR
jgi:hypothetical protein